MIDRNAVISGAALRHSIDQSTMSTNNIPFVLWHVCIEHQDFFVSTIRTAAIRLISSITRWAKARSECSSLGTPSISLSRKASVHSLGKNLTRLISHEQSESGSQSNSCHEFQVR